MKKMLLSLFAFGMIAIAADTCKSCKTCKPCKKVSKKCEPAKKPCCVKMVEEKVQPVKECDYVCPAGTKEVAPK